MPLKIIQNKQLLLRSAGPIIITGLAQMGLGIVDTVMMGHLGVSELAAGALAQAVMTLLLVFGFGVMNSVGTFLAWNQGANNPEMVARYLNQGIYVAIVLSILILGILWLAPSFYYWMGQERAVVDLVALYLKPLSLGMPAVLLYFLSREFITLFFHTRIIWIIAIAIIPVGIGLNYILMYGKLGLPALGIQGIAIATVIIQWTMLLILWAYMIRQEELRTYLLKLKLFLINKDQIFAIFKMGLPIGVTMLFEEGLFAVSAILMGYFGENALAAHQITLFCVTLFFMVPLGLSQAVALLAARFMGANQVREAKHIMRSAFIVGSCFALILAVLYIVAPQQLTLLFMSKSVINPEIMHLTTQFFLIAAVFQFFDSLQVISFGALRGLRDTYVPMCLGGFSYWILGLSSGILLAFSLGFKGYGLWWGLAIGIGVSGFLLLMRLSFLMNSHLKNSNQAAVVEFNS